MTKITPPRGLSHIYKIKTDPIRFPIPVVDDDGEETGDFEEAVVVVIKPNRETQESIERRSAAARARLAVKLDDPDSDETMAIEDDLLRAMPDELVAAIVAKDMRQKRVSIYYEHRANPKWADNDLLIGLEQAWIGEPGTPSLEFVYATHAKGYEAILDDPDADAEEFERYEEAQRVYARISEFETEVAGLIAAEQDDMVHQWAGVPVPELREHARAALHEMALDGEFQKEQRVQRLFHCTRRANDLSTRYFATTLQVRDLDDVVADRLDTEYMVMEVPVLEGKDSPGTPGSSPTTESTATDPSTSSGPEDAAA